MEQVKEIKKGITPILKRYNVSKASIFGSYARGEQRNNSDVDLLVELDNNFDLIDIIKLKNALEIAVNKRVDLVEYDLIRKELRESILKDQIPIIL